MQRYKIKIEYEGTPFVGWQFQKNGQSVQEVLQKAIFNFSKEKVIVIGAGRTDSGVHALAQVAHFDLRKNIKDKKILPAINQNIGNKPVTVLKINKINKKFHARYNAKKRTYRYMIVNRQSPLALQKNKAWHIRKKLNLKFMKKVAIIDFDVHHGNGTQDIFYDNEKVLYISSHQYPYYPGSGGANEKGNKDNVFNVPLNAGTQPHEFLNAYESIFKKLKTFKPEFILLSAGFDAHKDDPLAQINLESIDYYTLTKRILTLAKELCGGKVVSILEGGYDLNALKESVDYHVKSLLEN